MSRPIRAFRAALAFLTILPVRFRPGEPSAEDLAASRVAYPIVGAGIGLVLAGLSLGLDRVGVARPVAVVALLVSGAAITGGLHLDGLADTCDGLFLAGSADR